jgi:mannose-1-phosphate guanylyltransferase/mannose-6-phosphate isomerase
MIPVILSGGSGSRLWPVSRAAFPKQFCDILEESLFAKTVRRLQPLGSPWTVTVKDLRILTERSLKDLGISGEHAIYEPKGKNTAPAIALLCRVFQLKGWGDEVVGIFPADHLINDEDAFRAAVRQGEAYARAGEVVTLGVAPTYPATGYGYIETAGHAGNLSQDSSLSGLRPLRAIGFREKPNEQTARDFIAQGGFFWNAGMFIFRVNRMIELLEMHLPDVWEKVNSLNGEMSNLDEIYSKLRSISIDYGLMERLPEHVCVPCHFDWSDLGSWDAIAEVFEKSKRDQPATVSVASEKNFVISSGDKTYAFVDVDDLIVVDTPDALLISKRGSTERVKEIVDRLKEQKGARAVQHLFEFRPWGHFEILRDAEHFKSKTIAVDPGAQISYQSHAKRSEHWIIVRGEGDVVLNDKIIPVRAGTHVHIPQGAKHRIRNNGIERLEFVEVQIGSYFGEDDIVRYQDDYGRG